MNSILGNGSDLVMTTGLCIVGFLTGQGRCCIGTGSVLYIGDALSCPCKPIGSNELYALVPGG
jgi:hypothetical protein